MVCPPPHTPIESLHVSHCHRRLVSRWLASGVVLALACTSVVAVEVGRSPRYGAFGIDTLAIDTTVRPGDDFWAYANGAWAKTAHFADDQEVAGIAVDVGMVADQRLASLMTEPTMVASGDADQRAVARFYASWMDAGSIERRGDSPLRPYLSRVRRIADAGALASVFGTAGFASPFDVDIVPSPSDPARNEVHLTAGTLGMVPAYYVQKGPVYDAAREAYGHYVARILTLAGSEEPEAKARRIVRLETRLAQAQSEGGGASTVMPSQALSVQLPGMAWGRYLDAEGLVSAREIRFDDGEAVRAIAAVVASVPLDMWKDYLTFRFVSDHAPYLPSRFASAHADFFDRTLTGVTAPRERRAQGVRLVQRLLPEAVSRLYVARYLDDTTRTQMRELLEDVRHAYAELIEHATWMDEGTRREARRKIASLTACIGGPELLSRVQEASVAPDDLFGNVLRAERRRAEGLAASLDAPLSACERYGLAQGGNDFYVREANQILLPAGSLVPPFFDAAADPAVNYGAVGVTIGHEIGHGFDVDGAHYDADGKIRNWWSARASEAFASKQASVRAQYAAIEVLPGLHIDGARTLGENMADLTGTEAAYRAYERYQARHGKAPVLDGLTGEQRFFLALAQMRRTLAREQTLRFLLLSDTHSPSRPRVNAAVRNLDAWYEAFPVRTDDPLYLRPDQRVHLW